jgi:charged multivesicular body protein 7
MKTYQTSTSTLQSILSNPNLAKDYVDNTTDALAEVMADQEEIDNAIRVGGSLAMGSGNDGVDEGELERELQGLVDDEKRRVEEEKVAHKEELRRKEAEAEERKKAIEKQRVEAAKIKEPFTNVAPPAVALPSNSKSSLEEDESALAAKQVEWNRQYEVAQDRKREEAARADMERMKRDEKRIAAE